MNNPKQMQQDFLNPEIISYVIILNYYTNSSPNPFDINDEFGIFLTEQIMTLDKLQPSSNVQEFIEKLNTNIKHIPDHQIYLNSYIEQIEKMSELNELFQFLSVSLKELRMQRTTKLENGNIIDIFIRRCYMNFQKIGFSEMVKLFDHFKNFRDPNYKPQTPLLNQFSFDNQIQNLDNQIENFPNTQDLDQVLSKIEQLEQVKSNDKLHLLKSKIQAYHKEQNSSYDNMHKYFDKQLSYLFQILPETQQSVNKVNNIVINKAGLNFEMGYLDEALRCLSEGLRISQNNNDDESINYCLIYLYQISSLLGRYQDSLTLIEHAIMHSVKLQNPLLQIYSCINYQNYSTFYYFQDSNFKNKNQLLQKNIIWYESVVQAKHKLQFYYEQNLGNKMINKQNFLQIPLALLTLSTVNILMQQKQPQLAIMIYNQIKQQQPFILKSSKCLAYILELSEQCYDYNPCQSLKLLKQVINNYKSLDNRTLFYVLFLNCRISLDRGNFEGAQLFINKMEIMFKNQNQKEKIIDSQLYSKFLYIKNKLLSKNGQQTQLYQNLNESIQFNQNKGFEKLYLLREKIAIAILKYQNSDFNLEALKEFTQIKIMAKQRQEKEILILAKIYIALIISKIGNITKSIYQIQKIEKSYLYNYSIRTQAFFYKTKAHILLQQVKISEEPIKKLLFEQVILNLNKSLEMYITLNKLEDIREIYYLQSRVFDQLNQQDHREMASYYFLLTEEIKSYFTQISQQNIISDNLENNIENLLLIQEQRYSIFTDNFSIIQITQ